MRLAVIASLGVLSLSGLASVSCGSNVTKANSNSTGSGGSGGSMSTTSTGGVDDAGSDAPVAGYPAPFPAPPQVIDYGGPVIKMPKLVPVFFAGDDPTFQGELEDFISKVGATPWFSAAVSEYGVGPATTLPVVQLTETAPATIDDTAIQTWLQGKLNSHDPLWPANDANTVYVLHYPVATTITLQGQQSCTFFGGYHNDAPLGSTYVAYAVIPRCMSFPPLTGIDAVTGAESHEIAEAVTDPYPQDKPAYVTIDNPHFYWERLLGGGEVGDMCAQFTSSFTKFPGFDYTVQRIWSNKNAKAGHDPCQPELAGEVYFNAAPVLPDSIMLSAMGQMISVKGAEIDVGQSKTIDVQLFSEAPTSGPWTVTAENSSMTQYLGFSFDKSTGVNGDTLHLTITVNQASKRGTETFILKSTLGAVDHIWIGLVGTPVPPPDGGVDSGTDAGDLDAGDLDAGDGGDGGDGG